MMWMRARGRMAAMAVAAVLGLGVGGAGGAPPAARAQSDPDDAAALAGPSIETSRGIGARERTLVQRDFDGRLKRLETHPVAAAIEVMDLSEDERGRAREAARARSLAIERIIRENIPLVLEAQGAFKPGDDGRGQRAVARLYELAGPVLAEGPVIERVARVLPPEKSTELRRLVREYTRAAVAERMEGKVDGKRHDRLGAFLAERGAIFGQEIREAAERVFAGNEREFQHLAMKLGLTPEQEGKIKSIFIEMYTNGNGKPTRREKVAVLLRAMDVLDEEQRSRLRELMAEEARGAGRRAREGRRQAEAPRDDRAEPER